MLISLADSWIEISLLVLFLTIEYNISLPVIYLLFLFYYLLKLLLRFDYWFGWLLSWDCFFWLLLSLSIVWWSPWSKLIELLDNFVTLFVEFAFRYKIVPLIFLILIVLLIRRRIMLILWKKLFGKDELRPIHVAQNWPSRALVKVFVCWTILGVC
jgi:hypothetical protein